jgi:hypothetical protein
MLSLRSFILWMGATLGLLEEWGKWQLYILLVVGEAIVSIERRFIIAEKLKVKWTLDKITLP